MLTFCQIKIQTSLTWLFFLLFISKSIPVVIFGLAPKIYLLVIQQIAVSRTAMTHTYWTVPSFCIFLLQILSEEVSEFVKRNCVVLAAIIQIRVTCALHDDSGFFADFAVQCPCKFRLCHSQFFSSSFYVLRQHLRTSS